MYHWLKACKHANGMSGMGSYEEQLIEILISTSGPDQLAEGQRQVLLGWLQNPGTGNNSRRLDANFDSAGSSVASWLTQRHLILLDNGVMGVALLENGVEPGDIIVKFEMLPARFALRPVKRDERLYYEFFGFVQLVEDFETADQGVEEFFNLV